MSIFMRKILDFVLLFWQKKMTPSLSIAYPNTRKPNSSPILVTKNPHGDISGTKRGIIDSLV